MIAAITLTAITWVAFFALKNRDPSHDYAPNIIPAIQAGLALIVTLVIWLIYFALT
ncbi:hypothetical protein [Phaeobacter italicus]|uniref:hypothetical protein n=1 Tax=Phaeobacter italicus TaxID=481446 RepID=UPI001CD238C4|nr:hypothetical protein [Phaeobacter italicus]MCA0856170.1 hypothetical protein [Phaeobacter italicus]